MRAPCQTLKCPPVVYTGFKPWLSDQEVCHYCLAMVCTERWSWERKWDENPSKAGLSTDTILYVALVINKVYSLRYFGQCEGALQLIQNCLLLHVFLLFFLHILISFYFVQCHHCRQLALQFVHFLFEVCLWLGTYKINCVVLDKGAAQFPNTTWASFNWRVFTYCDSKNSMYMNFLVGPGCDLLLLKQALHGIAKIHHSA